MRPRLQPAQRDLEHFLRAFAPYLFWPTRFRSLVVHLIVLALAFAWRTMGGGWSYVVLFFPNALAILLHSVLLSVSVAYRSFSTAWAALATGYLSVALLCQVDFGDGDAIWFGFQGPFIQTELVPEWWPVTHEQYADVYLLLPMALFWFVMLFQVARRYWFDDASV